MVQMCDHLIEDTDSATYRDVGHEGRLLHKLLASEEARQTGVQFPNSRRPGGSAGLLATETAELWFTPGQ